MILLFAEKSNIPEMDNKTVKANILKMRKSMNITQAEMAERMGISRIAYRNIEKGDTALISSSVEKIADLLDSSVEELVLGYVPVDAERHSLEEMKSDYSRRMMEMERKHQDEIRGMKNYIDSLEEKVRLLGDLVQTKDEINALLKKGR